MTYPRDYTVGEVTKYINVKELGTTVDTTSAERTRMVTYFLEKSLLPLPLQILTQLDLFSRRVRVRYQKMVASFPTQLSSILSPIPT